MFVHHTAIVAEGLSLIIVEQDIHMIDVADPAKMFSVGDFMRLAHDAMDDIARRNPPSIVFSIMLILAFFSSVVLSVVAPIRIDTLS